MKSLASVWAMSAAMSLVDVGFDLGAGGVVLLELERGAAGDDEEIASRRGGLRTGCVV